MPRKVSPLSGVVLALFAAVAAVILFGKTGHAPSSIEGPGGPGSDEMNERSLAALTWVSWDEDVLLTAKKEQKLVLVYVYEDWIPPCQQMESETFDSSRVKERLQRFLTIKVDAGKEKVKARQFSDGTLPTISVLTSSGYPLLRRKGFRDVEQFLALLQEAEQLLKGMDQLEQKAAADLKGVPATLRLADSYLEMGRSADAIKLLQELLEKRDRLPQEQRSMAEYQLGLSLLMNRQHEKGLWQLKEFVKTCPEHTLSDNARQLLQEGTYQFAEARAGEGDSVRAKALLREVIQMDVDGRLTKAAENRLSGLELLGRPAPVLRVEKWLRGEAVTLEALKGKVVLLDLFQIICPGCQKVHPHIVEMQKKYGAQGLQTLGIAVVFELHEAQTENKIRKYLGEKGYTYPVALDKDNTAMFDAYCAHGTPFAVLIGRAGKVRYLDFYRPKQVEEKIEELLGEKM